MTTVFSTNDPTLAFNRLATSTDRDEQEGMMYLFAGAVLALRNPRAHEPDFEDSPERALSYLELLSLLYTRLMEDAQRRR